MPSNPLDVRTGATDSKSPGLDDVIVWLTFTVERDYVQRAVFPNLRREMAVAERAGAYLFYLTTRESTALLKDAESRREHSTGPVRHAFSNLTKRLDGARNDAKGRKNFLQSSQPVCEYKSEYSERWVGTKQQLAAIGIHLDGPWPGEPGGNRRWVKVYDPRGYPTSLSKRCGTWGIYKAYIDVPHTVRKNAEEAKQAEALRAQAQAELKEMPTSEGEFRRSEVRSIREVLAQKIDARQWARHGYSWPEESVGALLLACDSLVEAMMQVEVKFDAARHERLMLDVRQRIARSDPAFQSAFATLTKSNPSILNGRSS
jgi:hypothetical protein